MANTSFILEFRITNLPCASIDNRAVQAIAMLFVLDMTNRHHGTSVCSKLEKKEGVHASCREKEWGQTPLNLFLSILTSGLRQRKRHKGLVINYR